MTDHNIPTQVFGYRSYIYRAVMTLLACITSTFFFGILGFVFTVLMGIFMNLDAIDMMKITLNDDLLHVKRYIKLSNYDCKFWLKDIKEAGVYLKIKSGKSKHPDGSRSSGSYSWHQLHIILKDGTEQEIKLLGMMPFERDMLKRALENKGIPAFEIVYRVKR